jgi:hypothetical protein
MNQGKRPPTWRGCWTRTGCFRALAAWAVVIMPSWVIRSSTESRSSLARSRCWRGSELTGSRMTPASMAAWARLTSEARRPK